MRVTAIIPTYNRAAILRKVLRAYVQQSGDHQLLEVLVVDDGSGDDTGSAVEECTRCSPLPLRYLYQENAGLSAARNHGLREAQGDLVLFGDDDIIPSHNMVAEHVAWHRKYPEPTVGILGYVTWAPEVHATPFMIWANLYGPQFSFGRFQPGAPLDFRFGYFCNTSVKTAFLREHGVFSESFRSYGWEDLELSYRLGRKGYKLLYNPEAVGYHYKYERFETTLRRVESLYRSWPLFATTEAGVRFRELSRIQRAPQVGRLQAALKTLLKPLKAPVIPLLRPLVDTRIPLPRWIYDSVFYYYVRPLSHFVSGQQSAAGGEL